MKKEKDSQQKIDSAKRELGIGSIVRIPFRVVGWVVRTAIYLAAILLFLAVFASVLQYVTTGKAFIIDFFRSF